MMEEEEELVNGAVVSTVPVAVVGAASVVSATVGATAAELSIPLPESPMLPPMSMAKAAPARAAIANFLNDIVWILWVGKYLDSGTSKRAIQVTGCQKRNRARRQEECRVG